MLLLTSSRAVRLWFRPPLSAVATATTAATDLPTSAHLSLTFLTLLASLTSLTSATRG